MGGFRVRPNRSMLVMHAPSRAPTSRVTHRASMPRTRWRDELVFTVPREQMPDNAEVSVGDLLRVGFPDGSNAAVQVAALDDATVTLDANHPLAGKNLTFELELVAIE